LRLKTLIGCGGLSRSRLLRSSPDFFRAVQASSSSTSSQSFRPHPSTSLCATTPTPSAAAPLHLLTSPTLFPHIAAMFKQIIPRASTRGALSSGFQSAQALRSTAPSTALLQQRIWQRRSYATETGMSFLSVLSGAPTSMLTFAQRRRISLSSVAVLLDMSPPLRLARRASRYVKERGNTLRQERRIRSNTSCYRLLALRSVAPLEALA
jgi:hypothetical protein